MFVGGDQISLLNPNALGNRRVTLTPRAVTKDWRKIAAREARSVAAAACRQPNLADALAQRAVLSIASTARRKE